jgi:hypothetical protein
VPKRWPPRAGCARTSGCCCGALAAGILTLFLIGPLAGVWIVKGNLSFSYTLGVLPLTDPYVLLQSLLTRHLPETRAFVGAAIVLAFYLLLGGRVFCAWVCPVNMVTDAAAWLRGRLGIKGGAHVSRKTRYWILAMTLVLAAATGTLAWELVNPVSMLHRGLIFGLGAAWVGDPRHLPARTVRHAGRLVRQALPDGRLLRPARKSQSGQGGGGAPRRLQRLHGLLRSARSPR